MTLSSTCLMTSLSIFLHLLYLCLLETTRQVLSATNLTLFLTLTLTPLLHMPSESCHACGEMYRENNEYNFKRVVWFSTVNIQYTCKWTRFICKILIEYLTSKKKIIKSVYKCKHDHSLGLQDFCLQGCLKTQWNEILLSNLWAKTF